MGFCENLDHRLFLALLVIYNLADVIGYDSA